jgi:hypothetical protein
MNSWIVTKALVGLTIALPAAAFAQPVWTPGSEITGQPIQVTTNGVTDTIMLSPGGQATITSPGGTVVNASWTAANGRLCLINGAAQECVPYAGPFQAGQPMALTSSCGASETWLAASTNAPPPPPPTSGQRGERGR